MTQVLKVCYAQFIVFYAYCVCFFRTMAKWYYAINICNKWEHLACRGYSEGEELNDSSHTCHNCLQKNKDMRPRSDLQV